MSYKKNTVMNKCNDIYLKPVDLKNCQNPTVANLSRIDDDNFLGLIHKMDNLDIGSNSSKRNIFLKIFRRNWW